MHQAGLEVVTALIRTLEDNNKPPRVRGDAAEMLGRLSDTRPLAVTALIRASLRDKDNFVRGHAAISLERVSHTYEAEVDHLVPDVIPGLIRALRDEYRTVRLPRSQALGDLASEARRRLRLCSAL